MSCKPACSVCERLRTVTLEIVGEDGIDGVTMDRLSHAAGLPVATASRHYAAARDCLYATYDELSFELFLEVTAAFAEATTWESGFELAQRRLLKRMAANPAEARFCYVETLSAERELRCRRDLTRQWIVEFLADELARRHEGDRFSVVQIELLIGACFREISAAVAAGQARDLPALEPKLLELTEVFRPVPA
jgi:AcrR family transcriptional regulator